MSLRHLLFSLVLTLAILTAALGAYLALTQMGELRVVSEASLRLDVVRALADIPRYFAPERGLTTAAMQSPVQGPPTAGIVAARKRTDDAMALASERLSILAAAQPDSRPLLTARDQIIRLITEARADADGRLLKPIETRSGAAADFSLRGAAIADAVETIAADQREAIAVIDGPTFGLMGLARSVQALRDVGGREAGVFQNVVGAAAPVTIDQSLELAGLQGQVAQIWRNLGVLIGAPKTPPALDRALRTTKSDYLDYFANARASLQSHFAKGDFPLTAKEFADRYSLMWAPVIALRDAAYDAALDRIATVRAEAVRQLIVAIGVLALVLVVSGAVLLVLMRRMIGPLGRLTTVIERVSGGDLDQEGSFSIAEGRNRDPQPGHPCPSGAVDRGAADGE